MSTTEINKESIQVKIAYPIDSNPDNLTRSQTGSICSINS